MTALHRVRVQLERRAASRMLATEINWHFRCPSCAATRQWHRSGRARTRENSVIGFFVCSQCNEQIVVKLPLIPGTSLPDKTQALREYRTLEDLALRFPQSEQYGTLIPLGHFDSGMIVTRRFRGQDLKRQGMTSLAKVTTQSLYAAGRWLRLLHDACPRGYTDLAPDTERKLGYLEETYAKALRRDRTASVVYARLTDRAAVVRSTPLRSSWSHGDFKPENVLYDGHKCVGIDTQLEHYSVFAYDLASFLNHLLMMGPDPAGHGRHVHERAREQVIAGYGDISAAGQRAIVWAQLYFMLCYWGRYQIRRNPSSVYNRWRTLPLLRMLSSQL